MIDKTSEMHRQRQPSSAAEAKKTRVKSLIDNKNLLAAEMKATKWEREGGER